jgi:hypothetical protein
MRFAGGQTALKVALDGRQERSFTMSASRTRVPHPADAPRRLYPFEELGLVSGLSARKIKREVDEGRMGCVQTGEERGRMVEGQQYLDWLEARRRTVQVA